MEANEVVQPRSNNGCVGTLITLGTAGAVLILLFLLGTMALERMGVPNPLPNAQPQPTAVVRVAQPDAPRMQPSYTNSQPIAQPTIIPVVQQPAPHAPAQSSSSFGPQQPAVSDAEMGKPGAAPIGSGSGVSIGPVSAGSDIGHSGGASIGGKP